MINFDNKKLVFLFFSILLINGCSQKDSKRGQSNDPINLELKAEAEKIFSDNLSDGRSYRSYSSNDLVYKIDKKDLSLINFEKYKNEIIPNSGWVYYGKVGQGYIFCKGQRQLELIPPQALVLNNDLGEGDIGKQLNNKWNIFFRNTLNGSLNKCYLDNKK